MHIFTDHRGQAAKRRLTAAVGEPDLHFPAKIGIARIIGGDITAQLTAARQHLDYVLIYILTRERGSFGTMGRAEAVLMDVRSGYIYATASTHVAG